MKVVRGSLMVAQLTAFGVLASGLAVSMSADPTAPAQVADASPPDDSAPPPCKDVLLLGARGAGEVPRGTEGLQFGATLNGFRRVFVARAAAEKRSLEQRAVVIDAPRVTRLRPQGTPGRRSAVKAVRRPLVRGWKAGVPEGVSQAVAILKTAAENCPDQQVVLLGYAQGAMVMHRTLLRLSDRPDILKRIAGTALISDGDRKAGPLAARTLGAPAPRTGSGVNARLFGAIEGPNVGGRTAGIWQICSSGDVVCDLRGNSIRQAMRLSRSYRSGKHLQRVHKVAHAVANRTARWPLAPTTTQRVAGQTGLLMSRLVQVRVLAAARPDLEFTAVGGLPAGVTLSSDGRLRGVPTEAGTFEVAYTVTNSRPEFAREVTGTVEVVVAETSSRAISAGADQSCEVSADGIAECWGRNNWGQLGDGTTTTSRTPVRVRGSDWANMTTNGSTTCGVKGDGSLWCWGLNQYGQVGDGTRTTRRNPTRIGTASTWVSVSNGWGHTCALRRSGRLYCWGYNSAGQLGLGNTTTRLVPRLVSAVTGWTSVSAGGWYTCGTTSDGKGWCWGANAFGQLGDGTWDGRTTPTRIVVGSDWTEISASWFSACGLRSSGELRCWGLNERGQVGDGTRVKRATPTVVSGGARYSRVSVGDGHACAITLDGSLQCWGDNTYGQLGTGNRVASTTPVTLTGDLGWYSVDAGWLHTCGIQQDGTAWCWGNNESGQVGDGTVSIRKVAVPVS